MGKRKCGLVVCAPCSAHRISMPRKYIAQPAEYDTENELENGDELQTVRVCDPCVPDPNWGPPPQQSYSSTRPLSPPPIPRRLSIRGPADPPHRPVPVPFEPAIAGPSTQLQRQPPSYRPSLTASLAQSAPSTAPRQYHRMATYVASEKDVRSQNDELQECVICLEEFEVGAQLALLECFCKFHKVRVVLLLHQKVDFLADVLLIGLHCRVVGQGCRRELSDAQVEGVDGCYYVVAISGFVLCIPTCGFAWQ